MKKSRTLIVDGNNLAARYSHSHQLITSEGKLSGVVFGVMRFLLRFLNRSKYKYHRVIFAFDSYPKFRHEMYSGYKSQRKVNRKKKESVQIQFEMYRTQVEYLKEVLPKLGVITAILPEFEADDLVYKIIQALPNEQFTLYSNDQDFVQMVRKRVVVAKPVHKREIETYITEKPDYFIIKRALIGDVSDSIPGVMGIGEVRAQEIVDLVGESKLNSFIYNLHKVGKWEEKLRENIDVISLNFKLMSLSYAYKKFTNVINGAYVEPRFSELGFLKICKEYELSTVMLDKKFYQNVLSVLDTDIPSEQFETVLSLQDIS